MRILQILTILTILSISMFAEEKKYSEAVELSSSFLEKLKADTPFTFKDGEKYFGPVGQIPSLNVFLLMELGYLDNYGKPVKELPKYSPLGELLRMNRELFIQDGEYGISFFPSEEWFKYRDGNINRTANKNTIFVFVRMGKNENDIDYFNERTICFDYNKIGNCFFVYGFTVDGKSILKRLGFYSKSYKRSYPTIRIKNEVLASLRQHLQRLESETK